MMTQVNFDSIGGGGSIKTGTGTFSTINTESTVNTGISNLSKFVLVLKPTGWSSTLCACLYDADVSTTKYTTLSTNDGSNAWAYNGTFGTVGDDRLVRIKSISNGDITLISPKSSNFLGDYYWYAE